MLEDVPSELEDTAHYTDHDLGSRGRNVNDTAYRHVPCLAENPVRMAPRVGDGAALIGPGSLALSSAELRDGYIRHLHTRRTLTVEIQPQRNGGRPIDDTTRVESPRSLTIATASRPLRRLRILTQVPNGRVLWATRIALGSKGAPLADGRPASPRPYHDATPHSRYPAPEASTR